MSFSDSMSPELPVQRTMPSATASAREMEDIATTLPVDTAQASGQSGVMGIYDEILRSLAHGDGADQAFSLLAD
jgi:hypothetical protein